MSDTLRRARDCVVAGVRDNPAAPVGDPSLIAQLESPDGDCSFEALGFDSMAAMELCIFIECETRVALSVADLEAHPSVNLLARHLSRRMGPRRWFRR